MQGLCTEMENNMVHYFGIRHLSPAGACYVREFLDQLQPAYVLIEGGSDLTPLLSELTRKDVVLPAAIMAYSETVPIQTLLYPFAEYSPEYQAACWAFEHGKLCRLIDLPSSVFLAFEQKKAERAAKMTPALEEKEQAAGETRIANEEEKELPSEEFPEVNLYDRLEELTGEDQESYWERKFEHCADYTEYQEAAQEYGKQLRIWSADTPLEWAETLLRERYMKYEIEQAQKEAGELENIAVITGAFHVEGLFTAEPMTKQEIKQLPSLPCKSTLMPYSYYRLSKRSGYGAGNKAPAYYELLWKVLQKANDRQKDKQTENLLKRKEVSYKTGNSNRLETSAAVDYFCALAEFQRTYGHLVSSAEVIEAVRLSTALAGMMGSSVPVLADLRDAAVTCMGHGKFSEISLAAASVEIGSKIGSLPEGVSRTLIQDDFYRQLKDLKLEKYKTAIAEPLELDLRENMRVKTEKAAFLDLNRSFFLHKLLVLEVSFVKQQERKQENATWAESFVLQWTPEAEIQLIEATLKGDTIELAAAAILQEKLENGTTIGISAEVIDQASLCGMPELLLAAVSRLQELSIDSVSLIEIGEAVEHLSSVIQYGTIRRIDSEPLKPVLWQMLYRACLILEESCRCNNDAIADILLAIERCNTAFIQLDFVEAGPWEEGLIQLSNADDINTQASGFATAILLERGKISEELLAAEVERRLSPGIPADLGAGWFEGLAKKNRYALITRLSLWKKLTEYIEILDEEEFRRALVFLRRAFSEFNSREKCEIGENLGELWGLNAETVSEAVNQGVQEEELSGLDDFDFGDLL